MLLSITITILNSCTVRFILISIPWAVSFYIVPTPIGNLADITLQAINALKTRRSHPCRRYTHHRFSAQTPSNRKPLRSYHQHNEHKILTNLLHNPAAAATLPLFPMPAPRVYPIPVFYYCAKPLLRVSASSPFRPNCFVPALLNSGLPCNEFSFYGFFASKKGRSHKTKSIGHRTKTFILLRIAIPPPQTPAELKQHPGAESSASGIARTNQAFRRKHTRNTGGTETYFANQSHKRWNCGGGGGR